MSSPFVTKRWKNLFLFLLLPGINPLSLKRFNNNKKKKKGLVPLDSVVKSHLDLNVKG